MDLARQTEEWKVFWETVSDLSEIARQLKRLQWIREFAFRCGPEIDAQRYRALSLQIDVGEEKLRELSWLSRAETSQVDAKSGFIGPTCG